MSGSSFSQKEFIKLLLNQGGFIYFLSLTFSLSLGPSQHPRHVSYSRDAASFALHKFLDREVEGEAFSCCWAEDVKMELNTDCTLPSVGTGYCEQVLQGIYWHWGLRSLQRFHGS